ncbi:V-type proton ATPase subunit G 3 isoform X1 [Rattus norvegicus]|uniref:V-type proton ATPase subunit G 3 isoform X1 n=1 Tax=Rattus norvegicus TaxID=10116 RepID=UPI0003D08D47|nr:V-type proton ATPase subunit G 3 isoform X1 [Rattus norvegicus]|eukprot:XP_006249986.1 PREDICTED: V-type proton ATPase subunit G 3 isoform X1 [Rattus norvegicus]
MCSLLTKQAEFGGDPLGNKRACASQLPQTSPSLEQDTMTSQSQGIQQLLQAEKRAKDKLDEAKKRKGKRLRQAKEEAVAETDQYRMQREKEFRLKQSKVRNTAAPPPGTQIMGSQSHLSDELEEQTLEKIKELSGSYHKCMDSVIKQLLSMVCEMKPEVHVNYRATS